MDLATRRMVYYGLLGLLVAGSIVGVFRIAPSSIVSFLAKDGTLNVYMASIQPEISGNTFIPSAGSALDSFHVSGKPSGTLLSLSITIDSVSIHANGDSDTAERTKNVTFTFDVLKPLDVPILVTSFKVPVENVAMVSMHVSEAVASVSGINGLVSVKVPSGELKVLVTPGAEVAGQETTKVTIAGTAHIVFTGMNTINLTPVLQVQKIEGPE
jgi:hypothetical protein